jgi:Beta-lactamase enzyme family
MKVGMGRRSRPWRAGSVGSLVGAALLIALGVPTRAGAEPSEGAGATQAGATPAATHLHATSPAGRDLVQASAVGAPGAVTVAPSLPVAQPAVHASAVAGGVLPFGGAPNYGSLAGHDLSAPVVGMAVTPDGHGYWLVAADGGIFTFGDAHFYGSTGNIHLNQPIVALAPTPDGHGYWLAAADGGIFTFGDAHFYGSTGNIHLNQPIVALAPTANGHGYWLAAADGGIFTFGSAHFYGSAAGRSLAEPVAGMVRDKSGNGYWLYEGRRAGVATDPFGAALVNALNERSGLVTAFVLDLDSGDAYDYRPGQPDITASIVKVEILGTLLREVQAEGRGLDPTEQSLATSMIEDSDNDSATDLWNEEGGEPAVAGFDASVGMSSTEVSYAWGLTVTTAADQVELLAHLVENNSVLTPASRDYELGLMEHVTPSQAWGVSAGVAPGMTVAIKNGWLPVGTDWEVNSIGWVDGDGHDYLIAVLSSDDPSEAYGIDSISLVSYAAWAALGGA